MWRSTQVLNPPPPLLCCSKYLRRPVVVTIGTAGKATDNVTQRVVVSGCLRAGRGV